MTTDQPAVAPLPRWSRFLSQTWRIGLGLALGPILFGFLYGDFLLDTAPDNVAVDAVIALDMFCGLVALVLYPLRHRFPVPVVAALVLLSAPSSLAAGFAMLGVVSLATRRRAWEIIGICVLFVLSMLTADMLLGDLLLNEGEETTWWETAIVIVVAVGLMVLIGMYIGGRRQLTESLRQQVISAQRERQAQIHAAKADERTRIAREMHDVLAHRLSLVALHSGALEYRSDLSAEKTRATAGVIRENSQLALGELRELLGMLRDPGTLFENELARPQPTLKQLDEILHESRTAGTEVNLELLEATKVRLGQLPQSTGRHLYRIIQEALTNARRHAPGSEVRLAFGDAAAERLGLLISNPLVARSPKDAGQGPVSTTGLGLTGLTERARLAGGEAKIEPDNNGEFVLKVWLPW